MRYVTSQFIPQESVAPELKIRVIRRIIISSEIVLSIGIKSAYILTYSQSSVFLYKARTDVYLAIIILSALLEVD